MAERESYTFKIVIVGSSGVGKTAILSRLINKMFKEESQTTVGVEFKSYPLQADGENVKLQIWDTAGQDRFRSVSKAYFRGAVGALLVFDITQRSSFDELSQWMSDLNSLCAPNAYILLVGNKSDLADERSVAETDARETARRYNLEYIETSAKRGDHIADAVVRLAGGILRSVKAAQKDGPKPPTSEPVPL
jgi:small GTP-binding protein